MRLAGAIDIGGSAIKIGIVAGDGTVLTRERVPMTMLGDPLLVVESIVAAIRPMLDATSAKKKPVAGIGVSVAGFLNPGRTAMIHNANLPALREFELQSALEERLSLQCRLEVDSNAAVLAEFRHGAGQGSARLLGVTVGTGLGGGVIIDGELLRYTGECAGDIGHIIVDRKGRQCSCGARGCLEAMVNVAALSERGNGRTVREIITAAHNGDAHSRKVVAETGWWLGLGLASLSPLFRRTELSSAEESLRPAICFSIRRGLATSSTSGPNFERPLQSSARHSRVGTEWSARQVSFSTRSHRRYGQDTAARLSLPRRDWGGACAAYPRANRARAHRRKALSSRVPDWPHSQAGLPRDGAKTGRDKAEYQPRRAGNDG